MSDKVDVLGRLDRLAESLAGPGLIANDNVISILLVRAAVAELIAFRDRATSLLAELNACHEIGRLNVSDDLIRRARGVQTLGVAVGNRIGAYGGAK